MRLWSKLLDLSGYVVFLKRKFLRICPYGEKELNVLLRQTMNKISICCVLVLVILFLWNGFFDIWISLYFFEGILFALYLVAMEVPNYVMQEKENQLYQDLLIYFSRVKHQYLSCHHIPNAVYKAAESMSYEVQQHAKKMYQIFPNLIHFFYCSTFKSFSMSATYCLKVLSVDIRSLTVLHA